MKQLGEVVRLMKCSQESLDSRRDLTVIENFRRALELLDDYDHQTMKQLNGISSAYTLTYEECRQVIDQVIIRKGIGTFQLRKDDSLWCSVSLE